MSNNLRCSFLLLGLTIAPLIDVNWSCTPSCTLPSRWAVLVFCFQQGCRQTAPVQYLSRCTGRNFCLRLCSLIINLRSWPPVIIITTNTSTNGVPPWCTACARSTQRALSLYWQVKTTALGADRQPFPSSVAPTAGPQTPQFTLSWLVPPPAPPSGTPSSPEILRMPTTSRPSDPGHQRRSRIGSRATRAPREPIHETMASPRRPTSKV